MFVTLRQNDVTFGHLLGLVAAYRHAHELPRRAYRPKRSDSVAGGPETVPPRPRNRPAIERLSGGDTGQLGSSPDSTPGQRRSCPIVVVVGLLMSAVLARSSRSTAVAHGGAAQEADGPRSTRPVLPPNVMFGVTPTALSLLTPRKL